MFAVSLHLEFRVESLLCKRFVFCFAHGMWWSPYAKKRGMSEMKELRKMIMERKANGKRYRCRWRKKVRKEERSKNDGKIERRRSSGNKSFKKPQPTDGSCHGCVS